MTKKETEIIFRLDGKVEQLIDNLVDRKDLVDKRFDGLHNKIEKGFADLNKKIDDGQASDNEMFKILKTEIYDDESGLRTRLKSLEKTRAQVASFIIWLFGSGSIGFIVVTYWHDIMSKLFSLLMVFL